MNEQNNNLNNRINVNSNSEITNLQMPQPMMQPQEPVMPQPMMQPQEPVIPQPMMQAQEPVIPQPMMQPQEPVIPQPMMQAQEPVMPQPMMQAQEPVMPQPMMQAQEPVIPQPMMQAQEPVMPQPMMQAQEPVMPQPMMQPQEPVARDQQIYTKKNNKKMIFIAIGIIGALLVVVLLFLFVFNSKTLTCTMSEDQMGMVLSAELNAKFRRNEISNANINMTFDLGKYSSYKDQMIESIEAQYSSDEFKEMDVEVTSDDTKIYVRMNATKDNFKAAGFSTEGTYSEVKNDLEEQGFTCK